MSSLSMLGLALVMALLAGQRSAPQPKAQMSIACPSELEVEQKAVRVAPTWKSFTLGTPHRLISALFSEDDPMQETTLAPARHQAGKDTSTDTWTFTASPVGYWVSCVYSGTSIVVSQKLPPSVTSCDVEFDIRFTPPVATKISCR